MAPRLLVAFFAAALMSAGCGGGGGGGGGGHGGAGGAGGAGGVGCPATGGGNLTVTIAGLPVGLPAVVVAGTPTSTGTSFPTTQTVPLGAGLYTISASRVIAPDPIVRTVYLPTVASQTACVSATAPASVTVTYAAVPSSNKLWVATSGSPTGATPIAYASAQLAATGSVPASVELSSGAGRVQAFDQDGNLWANGGTVAEPTLLRLAAPSLGASGVLAPAPAVGIPAVDCSPGVTALAFGKDGTLWVGSSCNMAIFALTATQLATGGAAVTPAATLPAAKGVEGLAFDKAGSLWVSTGPEGHLLRYDSLTAATAASAVPALTLAVSSAGAELHPGPLVFDAAGNLWSNDFGGNVIFALPPAALGAAAASPATPSVVITLGVNLLLGGMAFDEGGGLWVTLTSGSVGRLSPAQLTASTGAGMPTTPDRIITSPSLGFAEDLAFYPAPAALPLASALP